MKILITTNKINWLMFLYYIAISTMAYLSNTFVAKVHKKSDYSSGRNTSDNLKN